MAKKKSDKLDNNDEINEQSSGDFNEADDSFGLPEVEYEPLDKSEEESGDDSNTSETYSEEQEENREQETYAYASEESSDDTSNTEDTSSEYVPGSYTPPQEDSSNAGKVIGLILVLVVAGLAIWYLGFYRPAQQKKEEARIEQLKKEEAAKKVAQQKAEQERLEREAAEREAAKQEEEAAAEPETGIVQTINERTGRFYVVVASAIDGDLAMDYANSLANDGKSIDIIPPFGKSKFHRVTVDNLDTWAAAENRAGELKSEFGDDVWVIKY